MGYQGAISQLPDLCGRCAQALPPADPVARLATAMDELSAGRLGQVPQGQAPLHAFCGTLVLSRASYVELVSNTALTGCYQQIKSYWLLIID